MAEYDGYIRYKTLIETKEASDKLKAQVSQFDKATAKTQKLKKELDALSQKKIPTEEYAKLEKKLSSLNRRFETVAYNQEKAFDLGDDGSSSKFQKMEYDAEKLGQSIREVEEKMKALQASGEAYQDPKGTSAYESKSAALKTSIERQEELNHKINETINKEEQLGKKTTKSKSLFQKLGEAGKRALNGIASKAKKSNGLLHTFGSRLKGLTLSLFVFNWISKGFNKMIESMKSGIESYAKYSNEFNQRMSAFKNSVSDLKNAVGLAATPLINALLPAITTVTNALVDATNKVNQFFSALTGKNTWTKAAKSTEDYAKSLGDTTKETKKAQGALASFDKLNVLNSNDSSDTSSSTTAEVKLNTEELETSVSDFSQKVKDAIESGDWTAVGKSIATKINGVLPNDSFWEKFQTKLNKGAKGLASGLNGFIKELNWSKIGSTIAKALNSALKAVNTFLKEFDFEEAGKAVMEAVGGFFEDLDWSSIAEHASASLAALLDFIAGLIEGVDWKSLPENVFNAIVEYVKGFDFATLAESIGNVIGAAIKAAIDFVTGLGSLVKDIYKKIKEYFEEYIDKAKESGGSVASGILEGIKDALVNIGTWIKENIFDPFIKGFKKHFGIHSPSTVMKELGGYIIDGLKEGISGIWTACKEKIIEFKDKIVEKFDSIKEKTSSKIEDMRENVKTHLSNFWSDSKENVVAFKDNLVEKFDSIKEKAGSKFESARENIKTHLSNLWGDNEEKVGNFKDKLTEKFGDIRDNIVGPTEEMRDSVKSAFSTMWSGVKGVINKMLSGIEDFANGMIKGINAVINGLNKLSFDVKNPFTGKEYKMGVNLPTVNEISIPRLATGGITTGSTLARIGEAGREAVLPLENNLQYLDKFADRIARKIPKANNGPVYLQIDGTTFARLLNPYSKAEQARIGISFT